MRPQPSVRSPIRHYGIGPERVELLGLVPGTEAHLDTYRKIDIALDTFPYNGTTTTCEALYMGVPVVTLMGQAHAGRVGEEPVEQSGWSNRLQPVVMIILRRQNSWRTTVMACMKSGIPRDRMLNSALCDGQAFAKMVEQAYRDVWQDWCESQVTHKDS